MIDSIKSKLAPFINSDKSNKTKIIFNDGTSVSTSKVHDITKIFSNHADLTPAEISFLALEANSQHIKDLIEVMKTDKAMERTERLKEELKTSVDLFEVLVYVDAEKKRDVEFLVDSDTGRIINSVSYNAWSKCVGPEIVKQKEMCLAKVEYNPTKTKPMRKLKIEEDRQLFGMSVFNTYISPSWKVMRENGEKGSLHPTLLRFFEHFVPDQSCREYLFERMMMMVDGRLPVILVMNTLTGTGKGLFVESIMRAGVGKSNWVAAPKSWDKSGFNSWMGNKQIVWFDEEKVMPDGKEANTNYLKRLSNDYQSIEKKGLDVNDATKVHCSLIITNNQGTKNFRLEEDNRRFSVLDVGLEKMSIVFGDDEQQIASDIVNNKDNMLDYFWLWLSENYSTEKHGSPFKLWKGATYKMFEYESRMPWQKTIIDVCVAGDKPYIDMDDLRDHYKEAHQGDSKYKFPYHLNKLENFLKEYTQDGVRLGKPVRKRDRDKRSFEIEVDEHWLNDHALSAKKNNIRPVEPIYGETVNNLVTEDEFTLDDEDDVMEDL